MKPTTFLACAAAVVAIAGCNSKQGNAATNESSVKLEQVKPPAGGGWTQVVNPTEAGGFVMGNPNAKVKLIEFGSMTCPHCREFDELGGDALVNTYVKSGQVSWEFRPYVIHGPIDLAANIVARCAGTKAFFPLTKALYKDQATLLAKIEATPQDKIAQIQNLPTNQVFVAMANLLGQIGRASCRERV